MIALLNTPVPSCTVCAYVKQTGRTHCKLCGKPLKKEDQ